MTLVSDAELQAEQVLRNLIDCCGYFADHLDEALEHMESLQRATVHVTTHSLQPTIDIGRKALDGYTRPKATGVPSGMHRFVAEVSA